MNTIRALDFVLEFLPEPAGDLMVAAQNHLRSLVSQYDSLAPTPKMWAEYPGAQWYAIDASEETNWFEVEPKMYSDSWWHESATEAHGQAVPLGIDWRLCKWQRPEGIGRI